MTDTNTRRLNRHSKQLTAIEGQQIEYYKILSGIDKKLSNEFFEKVEAVYEYVIIGNGVTSLKTWRNEIDNERKENKENQVDKLTERRKWVYGVTIFCAGVIINAVYNFIA
jgi:hypothetical protein